MPFKRNLFAYLVKHDILNAGHKNALQQFEARMIKKLVRNQIIKVSFINGLGAKNLKDGYILVIKSYLTVV